VAPLAWAALAASRYLVPGAVVPRDAKLLLRTLIGCLVGALRRLCAYVFFAFLFFFFNLISF
jgi:hypothetical protein